MALTKVETTITFADNVVPASTPNAAQDSNSWTLHDTTVAAQVQVYATTTVSAPNNVIEVLIQEQDGTNWDTPAHSDFLGDLDTEREGATAVKLTEPIHPQGRVQRLRVQTRSGASLDHAMTVAKAILVETRSS